MKKLFIFNPDCELAIANGSKYYMPSANVVQMMEDLAFLPAWLGEESDGVWMKERPDEEFLEEICRPLQLKSRVVTEEELKQPADWQGEPWGWSPKMCHWLSQRGMGQEWQAEQKEWYSRKIAREGVVLLLKQWNFIEEGILPQICHSMEEILRKTREGSWVVKAPWSSSGKGIMLLEGAPGEKDREWLSGMMRRQGYLMLERKLEKVQDFAMEFRAGDQGVEFCGWSVFTTGKRGEYRGNYIGPQENISRLLIQYAGKEVVEALLHTMPALLRALLPFYRGYLGVDMMIYRNREGKMCIQPCVEINLRYNMGIVALFLSRHYMDNQTVGEYTISFYPGKGEALEEHLRLKQTYPAVYKNNRLTSGYLNLTPVTAATHFVAAVRCY